MTASVTKGSIFLHHKFCLKAGSLAGPKTQEFILDREEIPSRLGIREVLALHQSYVLQGMTEIARKKRGVQHMSTERNAGEGDALGQAASGEWLHLFELQFLHV